MKKLIKGILIPIACLTFLTGCNFNEVGNKLDGFADKVGNFFDNLFGKEDDNKEETDLEGAKTYLDTLVRTENAETREDYELLKKLYFGGINYDLTWSVDVDEVQIVVGENSVTVDVDEASLEEVPYVLTATITDLNGDSVQISFNRKVLAIDRYVPAAITENPVEGVAYKLNVYQGANKKDLYINGKMKNTYYFDTAETYDEGIDIYVEAVADNAGYFYLYHIVTDAEGVETKTYINVVESGTHINAKYETTATSMFTYDADYGTMVTTLNSTKYYLGADGTYNTVEPQKELRDDYYKGYLVSKIDRTAVSDEEKVAHEAKTLNLAPAFVGGGEAITLSKHGDRFPEVKIAWSSESELVTLDGNKITLAEPTETTTVTLTATLTLGEKTATQEVTFTVTPNKAADIIAAASKFQSGEAFGNDATMTGIVTEIEEEYDPLYESVTFIMSVEGKEIEAYRVKGDGANVIAPGYTVTISGKFMKYYDTLEFSFGTIEDYEVGDESDLPTTQPPAEMTQAEIVDAAWALGLNESLEGTQTLTGVITEIDEAYSTQYNNISVVIVVENKTDKPILCYRLKGTGADTLKVGDTITVSGTLTNFAYEDATEGTVEFKAGCTLVTSSSDGEGGGNQGGDDTTPTSSVSIAAIADANNWVDATVASSFTYGDFTVTASAANPTSYGQNTGKYYVNGENWRMYQNETPSIVFTAAEGKHIVSVKITYLSQNTGVLTLGSEQIASDELVTVNASSVTFGVGNTGSATNGQARITAIEVICADGEGSGTTTPDPDPEPTPDPIPEGVVSAPVVNTAYYFGMVQGNVNNTTYYLAGGMDGYYLASTDDVSDALELYLEATEGGYYLYCYVNDVKTYVNSVVSADGAHVNGAYEATASTVYTFDSSTCKLLTTIDGEAYTFGTRNDKTYTTIGPVKVSYNGFHCQFYSIPEPTVTDADKVANEKAALTVDTANVTAEKTITLPAATADGVTITWTATNATVSGNSVTLIPGAPGSGNVTVTLTATISCGQESDTKEFTILVIAPTPTITDADKVETEKAALTLPTTEVTTLAGLTLPTATTTYQEVTITWAIKNGDAVTAITLDKNPTADETVTVVATISCNAETDTKEFTITKKALTAAQVVEALYALEGGKSLPGTYTLTGTITSIKKYSTSCNATIVVEGKDVYCYYLDQNGEGNFKNVNVGDTITVSGELSHYVYPNSGDSSYQFGYACTLDSYVISDENKIKTELNALEIPTTVNAATTIDLASVGTTYTNVTLAWDFAEATSYATIESGKLSITLPAAGTSVTVKVKATGSIGDVEVAETFEITITSIKYAVISVANPVAETPYLFYLEQGNLNKTLYLDGNASGNFLTSTEDYNAAIVVYLEAVEGADAQYYLYFKNAEGATKYINANTSGSAISIGDTASTAYTYSATYKTLLTVTGQRFIGTYNDFNTFSSSANSYIESGNFISHFAMLKKEADLTAADKVAQEQFDFNVSFTNVTTDGTVFNVPVKGSTFEDVVIEWTANNACVAIDNTAGTIGVSLLEEAAADVTVTATFKVNGETVATVPYMFNVAKKPAAGVTIETYTLTFDDKANRTSFSASEQIWAQNGITFTNKKASSTTSVADYAKPVRLYANSSITVDCAGMTKIEFTCNTASYATALNNSIGTVDGATVTVSGKIVTVVFDTAVNTFTVAKLSAQVRVDSLTVTAIDSNS